MANVEWEDGHVKELAKVRTIGELKKAIENYQDDISFGFRNQPQQELHELKYGKNIYVVFQ